MNEGNLVLYTKKGRFYMFIAEKRRACIVEHDPPIFKHVCSIGYGECLFHVLFYDENRSALFFDSLDNVEDISHEDGSKPQRWFIEHLQQGLAHEASSDSKHLLFAAAQRPCQLSASFE